jgi:hypothetical protein
MVDVNLRSSIELFRRSTFLRLHENTLLPSGGHSLVVQCAFQFFQEFQFMKNGKDNAHRDQCSDIWQHFLMYLDQCV